MLSNPTPGDAAPVRILAAASVPVEPVAFSVSDWRIGEARRIDAQPARASRSSEGRVVFAWPAAGALTGWFGERRGSGRHPGIDIDGSTGDPVRAAADGLVRIAGRAPSGYSGYGNLVAIEHANGLTTLYAHLSRIAVHAGDVVSAGDLVGAIGTTGSVTGSHLHFEVRIGDRAVDPKQWLPAR